MSKADYAPEIGYCTNVHAGRDLAETKANLDRYAVRVRELLGPSEPMPIGLWLSARTARDLLATPDGLARFGDWLGERGLRPFTFNGFPYGDFHSPVVKHRVYEPDWAEPARVAYTENLVEILVGLMSADAAEGSISTLPVGWQSVASDDARMRRAAGNLIQLAAHLRSVEDATGKLIHVDLEPEPGCVFDRSEDVVRFFDAHLDAAGPDIDIRRYLRVCHDVCHSAVMFEDQEAAIAAYEGAGIRVGKAQLSSAVQVDFDRLDERERGGAWLELSAFHEPRYLHQTVVRRDGATDFYDDLPQALQANGGAPEGEWRVHFHVPVFVQELASLGTTQADIGRVLRLLSERGQVRHFEVETYAWQVLPAELRAGDLAEGIARELRWVETQAPRVAA